MSRKVSSNPAIPRNRRIAKRMAKDDPRRALGKLRRGMYTASRLVRDLEVLASGDWRKILRRVKNKILGRVIARGAWKMWQ